MSNFLDELACLYECDKRSDIDNYTEIYFTYFFPLRGHVRHFLEIGVWKGASMRMWAAFFPNARIYGIDANRHTKCHNTDAIKIFVGDQTDKPFLESVIEEIGSPLDIIIDDGGHKMDHQQVSFEVLFPAVKEKGIYVIEDLHTSYWPEYGGGYQKPGTTIEMLKTRIDDLNLKGKSGCGDPYKAIDRLDHENVNEVPLGYYDRHIFAMHFYKSLAVILKK